MINDDVVKCPLCGGFTHIAKPELRAALHQPGVREQVEGFLTELMRCPSEEPAGLHAGQPPRSDPKTDAHGWNASGSMRRSPKE